MTVTIRGVEYATHRAAAVALGITRQAITSAQKRGTLDYVGLGPRTTNRPVTIDGVDYPSINNAAATLRCSTRRIYKALANGGKMPPKQRSGSAGIRCRFNGKEYDSFAEAARDTGVHVNYIYDVAERL